ncbi:cytochrome ubiquinol oxidase subunit I [Heliophilum fasciatum]|uniref:Cytochrome bd-I ubiquinol oxidase subunit 1 apoprotein n=1 Tax=Heliophilum fasciatum TaxID=35700 RepID=A0A4R2S0A7_9FIRM|nr:cytochrome ubiquinol oxidase subunit I [Heliophilum fasciatum]MCW2276770.1 cytochrome d ubiquinol oxidase subunit I [Heliophilum fasciatum]TCP68849.1 cytochrome bd-I ubiquinol oxidase subunit 1 apoprotein [Heliophilum fasciatum]
MDAVLLSRIQFAVTAGFHYIFPPLTIGLAWLIFIMQTNYMRTGQAKDGYLARFWIKIFSLSFAVGVATGIVMEFQFGTNWSEYSRYVGDIFGAPLAAEGILAFFLESAFVGVLIWGEGRVSPRLYWASTLLVAVGATLSAFWIIVANSWQQTPAGFEIINGRAELTDFMAAVFNPSTIPRYLHAIDGALVTGAFFVAGISALFLIRRRHVELFQKSMRIALTVAFCASLAQLAIGHSHAVQVAETQPEKLAAFEGLFETQSHAPLLLFGIPDPETGTVNNEIAIPGGLSILVGNRTDTVVQGLNDFPREEWPPVLPTFFSFHIMVALGTLFIILPALGLWLLQRKRLMHSTWFLKLLTLTIPLPFVANELGWMAAEIGRQPWIVYRQLLTIHGASFTVPPWQILASIILFVVVYLFLFAVWFYLVNRKINAGIDMVTPLTVKTSLIGNGPAKTNPKGVAQ